jgi:type IV pilus assembly protein PilP
MTTLVVCWLLFGCGGTPSQKPAAQKPPPPPAVKAVETKAVSPQGPALPPATLVEKGGPLYNPLGKPDPFQPVSLESGPKKKGKPEKVMPLQRFELSEFELVGILSGSGAKKALVQDLSGKGYFIQVGTPIGKKGGKVVQIDDREVVVEESFKDYLNRVKTRRVSLKLPQPEK